VREEGGFVRGVRQDRFRGVRNGRSLMIGTGWGLLGEQVGSRGRGGVGSSFGCCGGRGTRVAVVLFGKGRISSKVSCSRLL
jgi:hypothetical protein